MTPSELAESLRNALATLDASPAVQKTEAGKYEPKCVMDGKYIRTMFCDPGTVFATSAEAMDRAEVLLGACQCHARRFIAEHAGEAQS